MPLDFDLTLAATLATELSVSAADSRLPRYISVASAAICGYLNRKQLHYSAAYVEKVAGFARPRLILELTPVISIASITLSDGSVVEPSEYSIEDDQAGLVFRSSGWPYTGLIRPGLVYTDPAAGTEEKVITATYAGGWVTPYQAVSGPARTLPYEIEEACIQTAVSLYRKAGADQSIASEGLGDYSVTYRNANAIVGVGGLLPDAVLPQLNEWRRLA
jgi:hypothetical protein